MKIWQSYGSEHSMNLVMIGRFKEAVGAARAKQVIDQLTTQVRADEESGVLTLGGRTDRFTDEMLKLLRKANVYDVGPTELEQFAYEFNIKLKNNELVLTTDESDVSAFLKILIGKGARVEVFSAHDYPETPDDE